MPRPRLVDDLVPLILDKGNDHWWPRDYVRLARVSPTWLAEVRRRLYSRPSLPSFKACALLARTLAQHPHLIPNIRALHLSPCADNDTLARGVSSDQMKALRYLLALDGVTSLTLGGELAVCAERFLVSFANARELKELHVDGSRGCKNYTTSRYAHRPASLEWDQAMAFRFPNLTKLTLTDLELNIVHYRPSSTLKLQQLTLDNVEIIDGFLPELANMSWSHLRNLTVITPTAAEYDEHIRLMLESCPDLWSFHFEVQDSSPLDGIFQDLDPHVSLKQLYLSGLSVTPLTLESIGFLFTGVRDLTVLGRNVELAADDWANFVRSGSLPSLGSLQIPSGAGPPFNYWSQGDTKRIGEACHQRGVKLGCLFC